MKQLPFPLRVAAGIAVTTVERAREIPRQLTELPVTVASHVLQTSMRVQQHVTELAIRGDDALATLDQPEETPSWATFDEDREEPATGYHDGIEAVANGHVPTDPWDAEERALAEEHADGDFDSAEPPELPAAPADTDTQPAPAAAPAPDATVRPEPSVGAPAAVADYNDLTLPQLRARLRRFSLTELEELLAYERTHEDRPSFTGMLVRRITNVRQADSGGTAAP